MKVVINTCFGGFGLSHKAILRYNEIKGQPIFFNEGIFGMNYTTKDIDFSDDEELNEYYWSDHNIPRDDPALVQVVEELKEESWDDYAQLRVVDIPDGVSWHISEYDGSEHVAEDHRTWG